MEGFTVILGTIGVFYILLGSFLPTYNKLLKHELKQCIKVILFYILSGLIFMCIAVLLCVFFTDGLFALVQSLILGFFGFIIFIFLICGREDKEN